MRNFSKTGLSLSQAQSVSNLCNQKAFEIDNIISSINNTSATITIGDKDIIIQESISMPTDIIELLKKKSKLHACQAFLMESIKEKDFLLKNIKTKQLILDEKQMPDYIEYPDYIECENIPSVDENWGKKQLTDAEFNEFLESEAYSAHIGQFIHKNGKLDILRKELPNIKGLDWFEVEVGKKTPVIITKHHTPEQLYELHEKLANIHREHEQRVNYFKAKIKNLVTEENAKIARENSDNIEKIRLENDKLRTEYNDKIAKLNIEIQLLKSKFEEKRQEEIKDIVNLRINVDPRFQSIVDELLIKEKE
ncbi:hypothetical protein M0Q50_02005 [bacterium]|jgi:hypothetical protein|nr:hypothetical protein [bacterium]